MNKMSISKQPSDKRNTGIKIEKYIQEKFGYKRTNGKELWDLYDSSVAIEVKSASLFIRHSKNKIRIGRFHINNKRHYKFKEKASSVGFKPLYCFVIRDTKDFRILKWKVVDELIMKGKTTKLAILSIFGEEYNLEKIKAKERRKWIDKTIEENRPFLEELGK